MKKMIFGVIFIGLVFFGFRYLQSTLTEPKSEVNMNDDEQVQYLEEMNEISGEGLQDTIMTTLKQCFEMAYAYKTYSCLGTMITDEEFMSSKDLDMDEKGERLYNMFSNDKPIIEMNYERSNASTELNGLFEVSFLLLQESELQVYQFNVEETEVVKITKGGS
ncbi:hypothetical protein V6B14_23220 (plasmid) [Sporosarcina psychrophila]|uniref:hypothetical protein n=1 Tax=Sporosarcina psychrophila TaxID=1476 RepID=UPI0030CCAB1D